MMCSGLWWRRVVAGVPPTRRGLGAAAARQREDRADPRRLVIHRTDRVVGRTLLADRMSTAARSGRPLVVATTVPAVLGDGVRTRLAALARGAGPGRELPDESLVSRALVRRLLSEWMAIPVVDVQVETSPGGRPRVVSPSSRGPSFNATHSGRVVGVALAESGAIGIDIEEVRSFDRRLLERVFSPEDVERVMAIGTRTARNSEFARLWTIAETCAKATGDGLRLLLRRWQHIGGTDRGVWTGGPLTWASAQVLDGHACAIASNGPVMPDDITGLVKVPLSWIAEGD
jgi:phosphopantetheinyl transferase